MPLDSSFIPIPPTTAGAAGISIPMARGGLLPVYSADRLDSCSSFPATRRPQESLRCLRFPTPQESPRNSRPRPEDSHHSAVVRGRLADSRAPDRTGFSARMARRSALHLSRRPGPGESEDASQAGLSVPHHLGRDRPRARTKLSPDQWVVAGQPSRRLGLWRSRSQQRYGGHAGGGAWMWVNC